MASSSAPLAPAAALCRRCPRASLALLAAGGGVATLALLVCLAPAPAAAQRPGSCPPPVGVNACAYHCADDTECPGEQKCCRTLCEGRMCRPPLTVTTPTRSPEALCPERRSSRWVCTNRCSSDQDCRAGQICCQHRCGGFACVNPVARPQRGPRAAAVGEPQT